MILLGKPNFRREGGLMYSKVTSGAVYGIEGRIIHVEADISDGFPSYSLVGYLASEVKEAKERVTTSIRNSGFKIPSKRIIINLSPANLRKQGTLFDLPIAISILSSLGFISGRNLCNFVIVGELGLDGEVAPVNGILPIINMALKHGFRACIVPSGNVREGMLAGDARIIGVKNLTEAIEYINGNRQPAVRQSQTIQSSTYDTVGFEADFDEIYGQELLKRSIEIAVAGRHHMLIMGPPGAGKTMAVKRIPTVMPALTREEALEVASIYSVKGKFDEIWEGDIKRPVRQPHHSVTDKAMAGGGLIPKPGEITLSHNGLLFLDELGEFNAQALEILRQPLEDKKIMISRTHGDYIFPADFLLVAAMNPCKCGHYPDKTKCTCTPGQIRRYLSSISQPLLDRFDLCTEASKPDGQKFIRREKGRSSLTMRRCIEAAIRRQKSRYKHERIYFNAQLSGKAIDTYCMPDADGQKLLNEAFEKMNFSARAYYKILKVARTIADLEESDTVSGQHISEAICYRVLDHKYGEDL